MGWTDAAVADKIDVGTSTVHRCVERYESGGLDAALEDAPGRGRKQEISESDRLRAVSLACTRPKLVGTRRLSRLPSRPPHGVRRRLG